MKHFLSESLIVTLLVSIMCGTIYCQGHDYVQESNNRYKQRYIEQHGEEIKTLILGHSQAANGINPWVMGDSVFNMAELSRILYYDKEILVRNISKMPSLKAVIYPLMYQIDNGAFFTIESFRNYTIKEYYKAMKIQPPYEYRKNSIKPSIGEVLCIQNFANKKDCDSLGYLTLGDGFSNSKDFIDIEINEDSIVSMLNTMAKVCTIHGVRFIIVSMPCNNTFKSQSINSEGIDRINRIINSVNNRYPVEFCNYLNHPGFQKDELFSSQTHFNHRGATLFAKQLKKDFNL